MTSEFVSDSTLLRDDNLALKPHASPKQFSICFLANASSTHTAKWVNHFSSKGHKVDLISFEDPCCISPEVNLHKLTSRWSTNSRYFTARAQVRKVLDVVRPDLLHAHYAAGYGTLGRLANFHPYILSVWGSDVFEVPARSPLHRTLIRSNLASADYVCSTSRFMALHTQKYCKSKIFVTPFGIDCERFKPCVCSSIEKKELLIGTVKTLDETYGVDYLIKSFAAVAKQYAGSKKLRLIIAGDGPLKNYLQNLAKDLGIEESVDFLGFVPQDQIPALLNGLSIFVAVSVFETFGVAILEASACGLPVVVSDAGGLGEVMKDGITGVMVPKCDVSATAEAIANLIDDDELRTRMGKSGRNFVLENYEWNENASRMERLYESARFASKVPALEG